MIRHLKILSLVLMTLSLHSPAVFADPTLVLTPSRVKQRTLQDNLEVKILKLEQDIARQNLPLAKSIYDLQTSLHVSHFVDRSQRTSTVFGTDNKTTIYNLELYQLTPLGTQIGLGFLNQRDSTDSVFATINPSFDSRLQLNLRQPLAKNFFGYQNRKQIQLIKVQIQAMEAQTQALIQAVVQQNLYLYWNFYLAHQNLQLEKEALNKSSQLYQANQKKQDLGLIEPSDLYAFGANYDIHQVQWLGAKNVLASLTEQLRHGLNANRSFRLVPRFEKRKQSHYQTEFESAFQEALNHRPDYLALKRQLKGSDLQLDIDRNGRLPQVDALASLTYNGVDDEYGQAVENIGDGDSQWLLGMELSFPLQNRAARSVHRKSVLEKRKKELQLENKKIEIQRQVAEELKQYHNTRQRWAAAVNARENQYQKLMGEMKKYEQGRSDSDTVIRFHNDFIEAKKLALQTEVEFHLAEVDLSFVQGKILEGM